jgi:serine protease Do
MKMSKIFMLLTVIVFFMVFNGCSFIESLTEQPDDGEPVDNVQPAAAQEKPIDGDLLLIDQLNNEINELIEGVMPSVVSIAVTTDTAGMAGNTGVGSGVIYTEDGYIITNSHVAGNASRMTVILSDGRTYEAELIGNSAQVDIAVIKIEAVGLSPAEFATIEEQQVGDMVIAVGSPFGIQQTVTMGIISGKGRNIPVAADTLPIVDLVQTDTAINPGNSGGPLINTNGEVIGINTLTLSTSGTSSGVGFAIPVDTAVNIADQIIEFGEPLIPFIGVQLGINTTDINGAYVVGVVNNSPADEGGIIEGDIITRFGDKDIETSYQLIAQILRSNCGDTVSVRLYRQGEYMEFDLELRECPSSQP